MKTRVLLLILSLLLCAIPTLAQDATNTTNTVSFNGFGFSFNPTLATNVNISQVEGTGPGEMDVDAPHTEFVLYSGDEMMNPDFDPSVLIRVYRTSDFTGLDTVQGQFQALQTLLAQRGDLAPYMAVAEDGGGTELPYLPLANAGQVLRARAQYVDLGSVQGVSYLTVFRQDVSPFTAGDFVYTFQGLSTDGLYYVSAIFRVATDLFPAEIATDFDYDAFSADYINYLTQSATQLGQASPTSFSPSLVDVDAMLQSFAFGGMMPSENVAVPTMTATAPAEATVVNQDPTLGGLAGTWNLVSYGAPEAPQPVLPNAPITLTFDVNGVSGSAGCNTYGGAFAYNAGALTFTNVVSTLMACEEAISAQESAYITALTTATSYVVNGSQLVITTPTGVLTFVNAAAVPTPTVDLTAVTVTATTVPPMTPTFTETPTATP
jgi:heat shock protein HslJ